MKKYFFTLLLAICCSATVFAQSLTVTYVDGYKIQKGERPPIDLNQLTQNAYYQGKIQIKITREFENELPDISYKANAKGFVTTGVASLDALNAHYHAVSYTPIFGMLYETNSKASNFRERHRAWGFHLWFTITLDENTDIIEVVQAYQALSMVEVAEPVYQSHLFDMNNTRAWKPNDSRIDEQWHYHNTGQSGGTPGCDINLFEAWEIETGNSQVIVAIKDGGMEPTHPDLQANMWSNIGYNFYNNNSTIIPSDHGTHVGGTIAANTNNYVGVAGIAGGSGSGDGVRLMTCQIFPPSGQGVQGYEASCVYAADNGASISQNSWGYNAPNSYNQSILDAIDYFLANGGGDVMEDGIVIYAAGNNGANGNYYPGCYAPVFAVAATTHTDAKANYSNYGSWVDLSAPGGETMPIFYQGVLSTIRTGSGSYGFMQGTSMACPHVSGVVALMVSSAIRSGYKLSREEIFNILKENSDNVYIANPSLNGLLGAGRLNAYKALLAVMDLTTAVQNPKNIIASALSYSDIELTWQKNDNQHEIIIVTNTVNSFSQLENGSTYTIGEQLANGETVLYKGSAESFIHTGLNTSTTYFYKLFSFNEETTYSKGFVVKATTWCGKATLPIFENFEQGPNFCWAQENLSGTLLWEIGRGNGAAQPAHAFEGNYNIYIKANGMADLGTVTRLNLPVMEVKDFDEIQLSFAFFSQLRAGLIDELAVYYKETADSEWQTWAAYNTNQNVWKLESLSFLLNENSEEFYICFEGKLNGGFGICLDNIMVKGIKHNTVSENELKSQITIYPNPTTGELQVTSYGLQVTDVEILDVTGRKLSPRHLIVSSSHQKIDISNLNPGIYFVKIITDAGEVVKRVVKQ
ncbi:MAG: S8 family serine peptidase [Bacteroidetes bacterium]|nr:S8 family serine peptidase [Bacteroidota bacterium]MCL2301817.1 S8 family serine peptidase [Lentimicrobiaceae bacterium]